MAIYDTKYFIEKANQKHNFKYNYSESKYKNTSTKIIIICPIHGKFFSTPNWHLQSKHGCKKCGVSASTKYKTKTLTKFIEKSNIIHKNLFDYSNTIYQGDKTKCAIICKIHGEFWQKPNNHLNGQGCPLCRPQKISKSKTKNINKFIKEANKKHQFKYNYTKVVYMGERNKIIIICPNHGEFIQKPFDHLQGNGCQQCGFESRVESQKDTTESFIVKAEAIHNHRYNYSLVKYINTLSDIQIICNKCKQIFKQAPNHHLQGNGCSYCRQSKGELDIEDFLQKSNLSFIKQYRIKECRNKKPLPFDFAILKNNTIVSLIEYHGFQHYDVRSKFYEKHGDILYRQHNDLIKRNYCTEKNIPLLEIPYWQKKHIPILITNFLILNN